MFKLDEDILRAYFRYEEYMRQRLWMQRVWHPELFKWEKRGGPPPITATKLIRQGELARMGFGEEHFQRMLAGEKQSEGELKELAETHPLWPHFERIKNFGLVMTGKFIAAGGDIQRPSTASAFWYGMGLDVLADGTVPRRIRGKKDVPRKVPALPHVTMVGEQVRQQIVKAKGSKLQALYYMHKARYQEKYPDRCKLWADNHGKRIAQKILYATLWEQWRLAYGLSAPWPYAFSILYHDSSGRITIADLYDK